MITIMTVGASHSAVMAAEMATTSLKYDFDLLLFFLPKTFISATNKIMLGVNKWANRRILTITIRAF